MLPSRPNLFHHAPSELSQDAVLCWILAWADHHHAAADPVLHALGRDLIHALFADAKLPPPDGDYTVNVMRQLDHVDIVAELGATHLLVIEDKVHTNEHSNQLVTYAEAMAKRYPDRTRAHLFLKTGDQSSYDAVEAASWTPFLRQELLDVLRRGHLCTNAIYRDFLEHLEDIETNVQRYKTAPVAEWTAGDAAYTGLYIALQTTLKDGQWGYVPNPSGGFKGFWWNFTAIPGGQIYLQLEETALVAKIQVDDPAQRRDLRALWSQRVIAAIPNFSKPSHFGHGQYMTVATRGDHRIPDPDGRLDLPATTALLQTVTTALSTLAATAPKP